MDVSAIRVRIGLKTEVGQRRHAFPDWCSMALIRDAVPGVDNLLGKEKQNALQAAVDQHIIVSWTYDKQSGHDTDTSATVDQPASPVGNWFGMLIVTPEFATAAIAAFPGIVERMTLQQAKNFWEERAYKHVPDQRIDTQRLQGLKAVRDLLVARGASGAMLAAVDSRIDRALDPSDPEPGVNDEPDKMFQAIRIRYGITGFV